MVNKEEQKFRKHCDDTLYSIYSKINEEEKTFLLYLVSQFNLICERNEKLKEAIDNAIKEIDEQEEYYYPRDVNYGIAIDMLREVSK